VATYVGIYTELSEILTDFPF